MKVKVGQVFHSLYIDSETLEHDWSQHVVRTIRGGYVHLILKSASTYGKRSKKNGDYGWYDNIPSYCRTKFPIGEKSFSVFSTKLQAWSSSKKFHDSSIKRGAFEGYSPEHMKKIEKKFKRIRP
ncbi:MAG: hypothetical protein COB09_19020 [Thalassobium sp.]|nr:MAG: hypothetical protein COB09_19020 [Thalassobium sp.]